MTKGLRITVYTAAALTLAALLVLLLMPSQARYLRGAQWQEPYPAVAAEFTSDFLALQGEPTILLEDWSPSSGETKTVLLHLTCPAELLQMSAAEETAETQETASMETEEPVKVTLGAVDEHYLKAETKTAQAVNDGDIAVITVTLTLTAATDKAEDTITEKTVEVPLSVSFAGKTFNGRLSLTLWPKADESGAEKKNLFNKTTSMKEYDSAQPFYIQYTLPEDCTEAAITLDGGAKFPAKTRYSTDNGASYTVLYEGRSSIPVAQNSTTLLVDMSEAGAENVDRTLKLTATGEDGKPVADSLTLTAKSWSGGADVTYSEDGLPSMTILPWNSECLQLTAIVERLEWTKKTVQTSEQESDLQEMQRTVEYVSADKVVQIEWTTAVEGEDAATEGISPANAAETQTTQTLTLLPATGIVPAGTYRVTICWKCDDVLIAERVIPFFVTR